MGQFFSDEVETALRCIYYDLAAGRGQEGLDILEEAARRGDADACCVLARCLYGPEYTWLGHQFPVDADRGDALMRQAVLGGSAMAALTAMRSGVMDEDLERAMPFSDLSVPFRIVLGGAEQGDPFCQMVIGNVYYWWDFLRIEQRGADDFPDDGASRLYLRSRFLQCESWYLSSFRAGCAASGTNLIRLYSEGEKDLVPPRPEKELELDRPGKGARTRPPRRGAGLSELPVFLRLRPVRRRAGRRRVRPPPDGGRTGRAPRLLLGRLRLGIRPGRPERRSPRCGILPPRHPRLLYQKRPALLILKTTPVISGWASCTTSARASRRTTKKRFSFSKKPTNCPTRIRARTISASAAPSATAREQDYAAARTYLERVDWDCPDAFYLLGWMYCHGKGGPEDIDKGVALLQKAGDLPEAKEELSHYRQTLFTRRWVRR